MRYRRGRTSKAGQFLFATVCRDEVLAELTLGQNLFDLAREVIFQGLFC